MANVPLYPPIGGGFYGQAATVGVSFGATPLTGQFTWALYDQVGAGVGAAMGRSWTFDGSQLSWNPLEGFGLSSAIQGSPLAAWGLAKYFQIAPFKFILSIPFEYIPSKFIYNSE
jgi:hypothetical protein